MSWLNKEMNCSLYLQYSAIVICTYYTMLEGINWKEITGINKTREWAVVLLACVRADFNLSTLVAPTATMPQNLSQTLGKRIDVHVSGCLTDHSY